METDLYFWAAILGVVFRYNLGMTNATKIIGQKLSDSGVGQGLQDAITPPNSSIFTLFIWIYSLGMFGYCVYAFSWDVVGVWLAIFVGTSILAGVFVVPGPESKHFVQKIYRSMVKRYDGFEKSEDHVRSEAMMHLIAKIEEKYLQ